MLAMFSSIEIGAILVVSVLMLAAAGGVVYLLYRLARRAARDGARDAADEASSPR
jgi:hypothetical protein